MWLVSMTSCFTLSSLIIAISLILLWIFGVLGATDWLGRLKSSLYFFVNWLIIEYRIHGSLWSRFFNSNWTRYVMIKAEPNWTRRTELIKSIRIQLAFELAVTNLLIRCALNSLRFVQINSIRSSSNLNQVYYKIHSFNLFDYAELKSIWSILGCS